MRLTADEVWFSYGDRPVLTSANLGICTGEAVAIVGPSGVGKTTLLSLLGGMLAANRGEVAVDGDPRVGSHVSWVLQTVNTLPNRTVVDNVALGALADGLTRADATAEANVRLSAIGLGSLAGMRSRTLSGGELQRMVIARGLASGRPFLLADEPTGQLDRGTTSSVIECLLGARADRGIVIVTHDPEVAARCDRVYELLDGQLVRR